MHKTLHYEFTTSDNGSIFVSAEDYAGEYPTSRNIEDNESLESAINFVVDNDIKDDIELEFEKDIEDCYLEEFDYDEDYESGSFKLEVDFKEDEDDMNENKKSNEAELVDLKTKKKTDLKDPIEEKHYIVAKLKKDGDEFKIVDKSEDLYFNDATEKLVINSGLDKVDGENEIYTIIDTQDGLTDIFKEDRKIVESKNEAHTDKQGSVDFDTVGFGIYLNLYKEDNNFITMNLDGFSNNTETNNEYIAKVSEISDDNLKALKKKISDEIKQAADEFDKKVLEIMKANGFKRS